MGELSRQSYLAALARANERMGEGGAGAARTLGLEPRDVLATAKAALERQAAVHYEKAPSDDMARVAVAGDLFIAGLCVGWELAQQAPARTFDGERHHDG